MGNEDDQHWQFVRGRQRQTKGYPFHIPDIATAKNLTKKKYENLTTYFFTDFPKTFGAKAMFNAFQYYGDIVEVVIPAKRDKGGRRFGFARFDQVRDVRGFEQELDKITIGRDKISINLSRFHRVVDGGKAGVRNVDRKVVGGHQRFGESKGEENQSLSRHQRKENNNSYANVVKNGKETTTNRISNRVLMSFEAEKEVVDRFKKAFVGEVIQPGMSYNIQNAFHRQGYFGVKITPLGANLTLLEGQEEGEVQALLDDAKGWLDQWFKDIRPWSPKEIDRDRIIWLRVFGIPPHAWNDLFFTQLVKPWGEFMNTDVGTAKKLSMDVARISIRTSCHQPVDEFFDILVNGETFRLRILEDSYGPMRIILPNNNVTNGRDGVDNAGDEEEEDEEEEEEVEEIGRILEEDTVVRESEGDQRNLLALTPHINALNNQDNLSIAVSNGINERENVMENVSNEVIADTFSNFNNSNERGVDSKEGGVCAEDNNLIKGGFELGQGEVVGGSQKSISDQNTVLEKVDRRLTQSDVVGQTKQFDNLLNSSGGTSKQIGGVYSDGPRNVYIKLNKESVNNLVSFPAYATKKPMNSRVHPIPASIRKQQQLINKLHLRSSASSSTQPTSIPSSSAKEVCSHRPIDGDEAVHRNPPYRIKPQKHRETSQSSTGGVFSCTSLVSSDIRNCNKRIIAQFNHEAAQKVWNGAMDLGVVGDEGDEFYVKRILINENSEKEARIHREQHQQIDP
jgi:hypothetical protein